MLRNKLIMEQIQILASHKNPSKVIKQQGNSFSNIFLFCICMYITRCARRAFLVLTILMINLHDANEHLDLWFYSTFIMVNDNLFLNKEARFQLGNVHFKN